MKLETNATLSAASKLAGFLVGFLAGSVFGGWLPNLIFKVAPGVHPLVWFPLSLALFIGGLIGGLYAVPFVVDFAWSHVTAECPDTSCGGRVHALRTNVYRCDRCGTTHSSHSTGGSEFGLVVRRVEARLERALQFGRHGNLSVVQPGSEGALSDPARASAQKEEP